MCLFPRIIRHVSLYGHAKVVRRLFKVEMRNVVVGNLARRHEAPNLVLPQLFLLAVNWAWREADTALVELSRDQQRFPGKEEMVAGDVVGAPECILRHAVAE